MPRPMLRAGRTQIGFNQDDWKKERDRKKGVGVRLSISTTPGNVDEIAKRAEERWHHAQVGQLWVASPVEHVTRSLRRAPGDSAPSRAACRR